MRPRHKAAENDPYLWQTADPEIPASMRPRHKAAENATMADGGMAFSTLQ